MGNGLCAYITFAVLFVWVFNSATNNLQVGRQTLLVVEPRNQDPSRLLIWFVAVVVLSAVCFLHYFSARAGRVANRLLCLAKLGTLLVLLIAGSIMAARGAKIGCPLSVRNASDVSTYAHALALVLFSYQGWENAAFVSALHPHASSRTDRVMPLGCRRDT